jgi:hypothetical protein
VFLGLVSNTNLLVSSADLLDGVLNLVAVFVNLDTPFLEVLDELDTFQFLCNTFAVFVGNKLNTDLLVSSAVCLLPSLP